SRIVIDGNIIRSNQVFGPHYGGGIEFIGDRAVITNNTISNNLAGRAGGMYMFASDEVISGNSITANQATDTFGMGGGFGLYANTLTFSNNYVQNNVGIYEGGGGLYGAPGGFDGVDAGTATPMTGTIAGNTFSGNSGRVDYTTGGIDFFAFSG